MLVRTSIWLFVAILPISADIEEPTLETIIKEQRTGPNSFIKATSTMYGIVFSTPNIFKLLKSCNVKTAPVKTPVNPTTGIEQKPFTYIELMKFLKKNRLFIA